MAKSNASTNNVILESYIKNIDIFTDDQIVLLLDLKYHNGKQFLIYYNDPYHASDTGALYDYINMYVVGDFDDVYKQTLDILSNPKVVSIKNVIFGLNLFRNAEVKLQNKINANREQTDVEEGIYVCRNCASKRTIATSRQTRSLDEPSTIFVTCVSCKFSWSFSG